jgi:hypothetical protein
MSAACAADMVQVAATSASARKRTLPIPTLHLRNNRAQPARKAGLVTEFHFFPVRFIESFKLKAC